MLAEVSVIFLGPLGLSSVATLFYLNSDAAGWSKLLAAVLMAVSLILQFAVPVPFLAPLAIQILLCIWITLYYQLE